MVLKNSDTVFKFLKTFFDNGKAPLETNIKKGSQVSFL